MKLQGLTHICLKPNTNAIAYGDRSMKKKNVQRVSLALYKIGVKGLNKAGKIKPSYVYETKDFMKMLCPKHLKSYFFKAKKYIKFVFALNF